MRTNGYSSLRVLLSIIAVCLILGNIGCCCCQNACGPCGPCGGGGYADCGSGAIMNRMGMRQYKRCNYAAARHHFAKAIARNPMNPDYRHNLAMALQKQGDPMAAERIFRHNLTIDAMHQPTYHSLAQNLIQQGRPAEAQELMLTWADTQPYVPEANVELAWVLRSTGNSEGAQQALQNALRADPANPIALSQLGQLYQDSGQNDQAIAYYERSLTSKWDQPEVQSRLSTLADSRSTRRSAMIQNSTPVMAVGTPIMNDNQMAYANPMTGPAPMMAAAMPFGDDGQAIALEDIRANPRPRRNGKRGERDRDETTMAAYPLPNFDGNQTAWVPTGTIPGQPTMAYQTYGGPIQMGMTPQYPLQAPIVASGPTPLPMYDPAHYAESLPEMTAGLPVVDPH